MEHNAISVSPYESVNMMSIQIPVVETQQTAGVQCQTPLPHLLLHITVLHH